MKKWFALLVASAAMLITLTACGAETANTFAETKDPAKQELKIIATNFQFDQPEYRVKQGEPFTINFESKEGVHGVRIEGIDGSFNKSNNTKTVVASKPGTYSIICNISCGTGHSKMTAKLIVE
ncbi:cytochrome C oxidase subunit II [Paenibacillus sp. N1-5-1-14]|uniref:cytochrome C oxidase subunit II n=1 Tax=Paenibacillus radicibacter TaxID=2972488 RepID=UPI0021594ADB|nr:cytochrome C oxidase subunit II [Paenibacillus radicibacter]MCR8644916.1 cytochrome C oxidase subunit II [Paenibacillus radicibacter]